MKSKVKGNNSSIGININLNVRGLRPSATLAINEKSDQLKKKYRRVYKLGLGQSPFPVPRPVVNALKKNAHKKDYLPVKGLMELREAVADFNRRTHKINSQPEDIMIGPGSKELIFILQLVYYGDLIIPTPSWVSYFPQARIIGRHVQWVPTTQQNGWRLSPEKLELICRTDPERPRIVILNYPSNPTGTTYTIEKLKELADVARKYKVILISDEIYGMIHHLGKHVSIARFYPEGTIISSGLSKWCGAGGWRLGTFTFPQNLRWLQDAMAIVASETYTATSAPIQYAAIEAFRENQEIENYLKTSRKILKFLAKILTSRLEEMQVAFPKPEGAFYIFPNFEFYRENLEKKGIFTSVEMCNKLLEETGVAILPGSDFGRQPEELTARIAFVDFDGKKALRLAANYGELPLDDEYVDQNFKKMMKAFDILEHWLTNQ
ncbi:MAG: aminotransferase class I/II-fold pyridoxal phosphate-dependent enzyme [Bacteroidales bacterium]|nr:aminotransferase class I/II-fold pyridoxal phosphate-dependent enzyme [Bacteroidales bacterium]